jgi:hypothetical protein
MSCVKFEKLNLKTHPEFNERWLQNRVAKDPSTITPGDADEFRLFLIGNLPGACGHSMARQYGERRSKAFSADD